MARGLNVPGMRLLVFPMVVLVAFGCARTHRGLCEERVRLTCEMAFRCCTPEEAVFVLLGPDAAYVTSEGECADRFAPACRAEDARDDAVDEGRLIVDQAAASACVDALAAARDACDLVAFRDAEEDIDRESGSCALVTTGAVENGAPCAGDEECGPGGFCQRDDVTEAEGTCVRPGSAGEECASLACAEGLVCVAQVCEPAPQEGEQCPQFQCAEGNVCNNQQICEALPEIGEECSFGCARGAFCDRDDAGGGGGALGTCRAVKAPGEACEGEAFECGSESCLNGRCTGNEEEGVCVGAP